MVTKVKNLIRKFVGFFKGQYDLVEAETVRTGKSYGSIVREIFDLGIPKYRKLHKLNPTYPMDFTNDKNFK